MKDLRKAKACVKNTPIRPTLRRKVLELVESRRMRSIPKLVGTYQPELNDLVAHLGKLRLIVEVKSTYTLRWTQAHTPEKFGAATRWCKKHAAVYVVIVLKPGKRKAAFFRMPKNSESITPKNAEYTKLILQSA